MSTHPSLSYGIDHEYFYNLGNKDRGFDPHSTLFLWSLTHNTIPFSNIDPAFSDRAELLGYIIRRFGMAGTYGDSSNFQWSQIISTIAIEKIAREWDSWVCVHLGSHLSEEILDNRLMKIMYPFVLKRDFGQCVNCKGNEGLTIHHIIRKQRNNPVRSPPFGRSVPTNLITLCRLCHSLFEPLIF